MTIQEIYQRGALITRKATQADHEGIVKIARTTKYTTAYGHIMFSSPDHYTKGWIYVAVNDEEEVVGFACVRHKVRSPETNVYFVGVDQELRSQGIGARLLLCIALNSPHERIVLKVARDNERAKKFYDFHNFAVEKTEEDYWHMATTRQNLTGYRVK